MIRKLIFTFLILWICSVAYATDYYIDGATGNNNDSGLTLALAWATVGKANTTLVAGDTVYIRTGTYTDTIVPTNVGSAGNYITYINYNSELVFIDPSGIHGANLANKSYIKIDGMRMVDINGEWVSMRTDSNYNIVQNCYFDGNNKWGGIWLQGGASYNQILNNTLIATCLPADIIYLRGGGNVTHNLIQGNDLQYGSHQGINILGAQGGTVQYNIVKNNTIWNPWHTCLATFKGTPNTLIEGNTILDGGDDKANNSCGSQRDRDMARHDHGGHQFDAVDCIIRKNVIVNCGGGFATNNYGGYANNDNRYYHNTSVQNYRNYYSNTAASVTNNIYKNNIFYQGVEYDIDHTITGSPRINYFISNNISGGTIRYYPEGNQTLAWLETNYATLFYDNLNANPLFVDQVNRNFNLQASSTMIDAGAWLTTITSTTGSGSSFTVNDSRYFMDGWGVITGDVIQLEGQSTTRTITNVNYGTHTITVDSSVGWTNGDGVALAYSGTKPDIGAYEYVGGGSPSTPTPTKMSKWAMVLSKGR